MNNDRIWILLTRKLSGEATLTELEELDLLISRFPEFEKTVALVSTTWETGCKTDLDFLEATYLQHLERMKTIGFSLNSDETILNENKIEHIGISKSISGFSKIFILAAVVLLMTSVLLILKQTKESFTALKKNNTSQVFTYNGTRSKILLPDGSNVWLNAGSSLNYSKKFDSDLREVYLSGEAFFDVVKNSKRPFVIHTSKMDIKVLGTQFNVKAYELDKTFETSLINGSVEVFLKNNSGKKYVLKPNQKLVLLNELSEKRNSYTAKSTKELPYIQIKELTYVKGTDTNIESSWTKNILAFEDEAFTEVAKKMERWYDVTIEFKNNRWEEQYLSGSFEKESLEQSMKALQFSTGFTFEIKDKNVIIY